MPAPGSTGSCWAADTWATDVWDADAWTADSPGSITANTSTNWSMLQRMHQAFRILLPLIPFFHASR